MSVLRVYSLFLLLLAALPRLEAAGWEELKIGPQPYVTLESFCAFYQFSPPPAPVPDQDPFEISSPYGKLQFTANSRDMLWNGRRVWLSFAFVRDEAGRGYVSKLDVIKLFDPLLRRGEMAPRKKLEGVIIDAGHGGTDNGAQSRSGYFEKDATLDTATRLKALLDAAGIPNRMTRDTDEFILLEGRASIANGYPGWIFVSLHYNSGPSHAHGIETYCLTPQYSSSTGDSGRPTAKDRIAEAGNAQDALNLVLADYIHHEVSKMHSKEGDRGLKRARFVVLRKVKIPGVLVEGGFLSHSTDSKLIGTGSYRQKLAQAILAAIQNYSKLMNSPIDRAPMSLQPAGNTSPAKAPAPKVPEPTPTPAATPTPTPRPAPPEEEAKPAEKKQETPEVPEPEKKSVAPVIETDPRVLLSKPVVVPRTPEHEQTEAPKEDQDRPQKEEETTPP